MRFACLRFEEPRRFNRRRPFVFRHIDFKQRSKCIEMFARHLGKPAECGFRSVEETCSNVVLSQLLQCTSSLFLRQISTVVNMPMKANRTLKFASLAKQVAKHVMQIDQIRVNAHNFNERINGLVGFSVQKQGKTVRIGFGKIRRVVTLPLI